MLAHGISAGALFILSGQLYERMGTFDLREMGGLWSRLSILPAMSLFFAVASLGLPGMGNFVGEFLILLGAYKVAPFVTILTTSGLVFGAVYSLIIIQRSLHGPPRFTERFANPSARELSLLFSLAAMLLAIGLYPQPILNISSAAMVSIERQYSNVTPQAAPVETSLLRP